MRENTGSTARLIGEDWAAGVRPAAWLQFAASPTFALMAVLSALPQGTDHVMACPAAMNTSPLGSMAVMYALMGVFHVMPWLKVFSRRRGSRGVPGVTVAER